MSVSLVSESARVRLAHLALEAARNVPGVVGTDVGPGGLCVTADPPHGVLHGVSVIAQADRRYEISMCLTAKLVPLLALGEAVANAVRRRIERDGLASLLGEVYVQFAEVLTDAEIVAERLRAAEIASAQALAAQAAAADSTPDEEVVVVAARVPPDPKPTLPTEPPPPQEPSSLSEPDQPAGASPRAAPAPAHGQPPTPAASSPSSSASAATATEPPTTPCEAPRGKVSSPDSVADQEREP